ncbi:unnamed protein product, partial [Allacma fusca]
MATSPTATGLVNVNHLLCRLST